MIVHGDVSSKSIGQATSFLKVDAVHINLSFEVKVNQMSMSCLCTGVFKLSVSHLGVDLDAKHIGEEHYCISLKLFYCYALNFYAGFKQ